MIHPMMLSMASCRTVTTYFEDQNQNGDNLYFKTNLTFPVMKVLAYLVNDLFNLIADVKNKDDDGSV